MSANPEKASKAKRMVPIREKVAMFFQAGSYSFVTQYVSNFMAMYLLMVGIDAGISAAVMLFIKIWDSGTDILVGILMDKISFKPGRNRFTRWLFSGRYMPWFRLLFLILPLGNMVLFTINTAAPMGWRIAQYVIGYILYDLGTTVVSAYNLLPISTTNNLNERNNILAINGLGQGVGALPVVFIGTVLIAGSVGYAGSAVIFSLLAILLALIPSFMVKERNVNEKAEGEGHYTIKEMFRTLKVLPELLLQMLGNVLWGLFYTTAYNMFICYYIFEDAGLSIILTVFAILPSVVLIPFLPAIFKRVDKIMVARVCCFLFAGVGVVVCILGPGFFKANIPLMYLVTLIQSICYVMTMFSTGQMMPDIVETAKYRTGKDLGGIISALSGFASKLANSLVASVSLLILSFYGFASVEANSFEELAALNAQGIGLQTERALEGLWNVVYFFPIFGFGLAGVAFCFIKMRRQNIQVYMKANSGELSREEAESLLKK